jgi:protein-tyrosine phosphatase
MSWRDRWHARSTGLYGPSPSVSPLSWIADERIAIGCLPTGRTLPALTTEGVTHVVNCRSMGQIRISQDLAAERALLGPSRVVHAPMRDLGQPQPPRLWSAAALFAKGALDASPDTRVLVHCQQGRRRSVFVAYAILRLRGRTSSDAVDLIAGHRTEARFVEAYTRSVEDWLSAGATAVGPLRLR